MQPFHVIDYEVPSKHSSAIGLLLIPVRSIRIILYQSLLTLPQTSFFHGPLAKIYANIDASGITLQLLLVDLHAMIIEAQRILLEVHLSWETVTKKAGGRMIDSGMQVSTAT